MTSDEMTPEEKALDGTAPDGTTREGAASDETATADEAAEQDATGQDAADGPDPASEPEAEEQAPESPRHPKRRSRRVTRAVMTPEMLAGDAAAATTGGAAGGPPLDVLAELAELRASPVLSASDERLKHASTAVLFQAPDLTQRPRRRRVQSQAGSPEEISEATRSARDDADAEDGVAEGTEETAAAPDQPAPARGRRRRSPASSEAAAETPEATDEPDETAPDEPTDGEDEARSESGRRRRRRRGRRSRADRPDDAQDGAESAEGSQTGEAEPTQPDDAGSEESTGSSSGSSSSRRRRRRRGSRSDGAGEARSDEVTALRGSTRLEAKRQRRRDGRESGRRRQIITEAEFLARRESVERQMVVRERDGRTQIAVLEDGVLVEHYVSDQAQSSMVGNVYLGRVQNVLPSMEAAFVDVGKGRNAVLYAGEVNWDAAGLDGGQPRRIEQALKSGDTVLVQVTKDPIGHKGARLTSQVTLAGRYLVLVPRGGMTGISHKLPDAERNRLKKVLRTIVPDAAGVIVRTAAEGATEAELAADIARLQAQWDAIEAKSRTASAPALLQGEPDLAIRVVRDVFNDDFAGLVVSGDQAWTTISGYVSELAPDLSEKVAKWTGPGDVFAKYRIDEQLAKGMDRKVWLPSGGSLIIDRTEAMTVIDVNTGKFTGSGGTLEETVTRNNLEAAEEIVRQLRLRDIGGMIVVDFIDMVLESNRDLVLRRLVEALGRDRTKHQVAEVTSLGLVQLTRKRVGQGLVEAFSETCEHCHGRGFIVQAEPVGASRSEPVPAEEPSARRKHRRRSTADAPVPVLPEAREAVKAKLATIAAAAAQAHEPQPESVAPEGAVPDAADGAGSDGAGSDGAGADNGAVAATPDAQAVEPSTDQAEDAPLAESVSAEQPADEETTEKESAEPETAEQDSDGSDTAGAVGLTGGVAQP